MKLSDGTLPELGHSHENLFMTKFTELDLSAIRVKMLSLNVRKLVACFLLYIVIKVSRLLSTNVLTTASHLSSEQQ